MIIKNTNLQRYGLFTIILLLSLIFALPEAQARYSHIVFDAKTGKVLDEKDPHAPRQPASLTKMMTVYMTFDAVSKGKVKWNQNLRVSKRASKQPPSKLGLNAGDTISLHDAVMALITRSANDMAVVVGESLGGNEANFARMMTERAHKLGMTRTTFRNASGLPAKGQITTARDMGVLGQALIRDFPTYYKMFNTESFTFRGEQVNNHNHLLGNYPGVDGIKTGYIRASGFNLVASAEREDHRLVGVVMGGRTAAWRDRQMQKLLDYGFNRVGVSKSYASYKVHNSSSTSAASDNEENFGNGQNSSSAEDNTPSTEDTAIGDSAGEKTIIQKKQSSAADSIAAPDAIPPIETAEDTSNSATGLVATTEPQNLASLAAESTPAWGLQVGAFLYAKQAEQAAQRAQQAAKTLLDKAEIKVSEIAQGSKRLYRARLLGLNQADAGEACSTLKKQKLECKIIPPDNATS